MEVEDRAAKPAREAGVAKAVRVAVVPADREVLGALVGARAASASISAKRKSASFVSKKWIS